MKEILIFLAGILIWIVYSSSKGWIEAITFSRQGDKAFKWNEHILLRGNDFAASLLLAVGHFLSVIDLLFLGLNMLLVFPFFHDGFYYKGRSRIDEKYYRFDSDSTTTTAKINFPWYIRLLLFIISIVLMFIYYILRDSILSYIPNK